MEIPENIWESIPTSLRDALTVPVILLPRHSFQHAVYQRDPPLDLEEGRAMLAPRCFVCKLGTIPLLQLAPFAQHLLQSPGDTQPGFVPGSRRDKDLVAAGPTCVFGWKRR
jgi:hypothetical protein